jgi:serine/threonine-protein kinase
MPGLHENIGPYRLDREIGRGGMGVVYLAHDTRLDRDVAIKVLPPAVTEDQERLARFEREARMLATLNHPNVAAVYGLEEVGGTRYLVLEYVDGETLDTRLERGPLPTDDALAIARQMAEAIESAHEKGIIHRDLKPGNVMVTVDDRVKVLDFGLAKAFEEHTSSSSVSASSPTVLPENVPRSPTVAGVILGTAGYMSPEQARGKRVDKRSDIWSFGCVFFEMLSGARVFPGESVTDSLGATLHKDPEWGLLPPETPPTVQLLLRRCLHKDRDHRLQDIGDARVEIEEALSDPLSSSLSFAGPAVAARRRLTVPWPVAAALAIVTGVALTWSFLRPVPRPDGRFSIGLPDNIAMATGISNNVTISPDGRHIVFAAGRLYVRAIDEFEARPIPETEGALGPFFSPDGHWIGYHVSGVPQRTSGRPNLDNALRKVPLDGGGPVTICEAVTVRGADWGPDDTIIFTPSHNEGLYRVAATGGAPRAVTSPDREAGTKTHRFPQLLPGGRAVLFMIGTAYMTSYDEAQIAVLDLETGEQKILIEGGLCPRYISTGHIVYGRSGSMLALPFDVDRLEVTGPPFTVLDGMMTSGIYGNALYTCSDEGTLVYAPGELIERLKKLVIVDRKGEPRELDLPARPYYDPRFAPDGDRLAVTIYGANDDLWIVDLKRGTLSRLTAGWDDSSPVWSPDGRSIAYQTNRYGTRGLYRVPVDGSAEWGTLLENDVEDVTSWSADGRLLLFTRRDPDRGFDIWIRPEEGDAEPLLSTRFDEGYGRLSPDGRWLAYIANDTGRDELYVRPFRGPGRRWQISSRRDQRRSGVLRRDAGAALRGVL